MNKTRFQRLLCIEKDDEDKMNELEVGDCFLYGTSMINQKQSKTTGQPISYFKVITKRGPKHIEYGPIYDILEEVKEDDGKRK